MGARSLKIFYDMLLQLHYLPIAVILSVLLIFVYMFVAENKGKSIKRFKQFLKNRWLTAFIVCLAFVFSSTLLGRPRIKPYKNLLSNFGLFVENGFNTELIENILLFIPYAFLFIQAYRPKNPWKSTIALSVVSSIVIELSQLFFWLGEFQLSDIVHNLIGGIVGCGLWYLFDCIIKKRIFLRIWKGKGYIADDFLKKKPD